MFDIHNFGKLLIFFGIILVAVGILFIFAGRIPWFGKLPGDIYIKKENFVFYFPLTTSILISIILSLVLLFISKKQ